MINQQQPSREGHGSDRAAVARLFHQEAMKREIETHLFQEKYREPKCPQGPPANQII